MPARPLTAEAWEAFRWDMEKKSLGQGQVSARVPASSRSRVPSV